jgi:hypothetical protein
MSSFWRFTLFGLFGAAGIGLALCVAMSSPPTAAAIADPSAPNAKSETSVETGFQPPQERVVEQVQPRIAANPPSDGSLAPNPGIRLAQAAGTPSLGPPAQMSQAEVLDQLRQQLQRALPTKQESLGGQLELPSLPDGGPRRATENPLPSGAVPPALAPAALPAPGNAAATAKSKPRITRLPGAGENNLSIHIQDSDLRDVLEVLSEQGGLNILPSAAVQGKVSASLNGVDVDTALMAILRSTGFIARHDGPFIYVGTPQDVKSMEQAVETLGT